jgi:hypothetical protein
MCAVVTRFVSSFFILIYFNISADKHTKSFQINQGKKIFNPLKIKHIKTTFFDSKYVALANKIANCRKDARARASARRVNRVDFRKILAGMLHFMEAAVSLPGAVTVDRGPLRDL